MRDILPEIHRNYGTDIAENVECLKLVANRPEMQLILPKVIQIMKDSYHSTNKGTEPSNDDCSNCKRFFTKQMHPNCWIHAVVQMCLSFDDLPEKSLREVNRIFSLLHSSVDTERGRYWKKVSPLLASQNNVLVNPEGGDALTATEVDERGIIILETAIRLPEEDINFVKISDTDFFQVHVMDLSCPAVEAFTEEEKRVSQEQFSKLYNDTQQSKWFKVKPSPQSIEDVCMDEGCKNRHVCFTCYICS